MRWDEWPIAGWARTGVGGTQTGRRVALLIHPPVSSPVELWRCLWACNWTNSQTPGAGPSQSFRTSLFLLEKKGKKEKKWKKGGDEDWKWKTDAQPCLVWKSAVGRMMSQILSPPPPIPPFLFFWGNAKKTDFFFFKEGGTVQYESTCELKITPLQRKNVWYLAQPAIVGVLALCWQMTQLTQQYKQSS